MTEISDHDASGTNMHYEENEAERWAVGDEEARALGGWSLFDDKGKSND